MKVLKSAPSYNFGEIKLSMDYTIGFDFLVIDNVSYSLIPCEDVVDAVLIACDSDYAAEQTEAGDQIVRSDLRAAYSSDLKTLAENFGVKIVVKSNNLETFGSNDDRVLVILTSELGAYILARKTGVWSYVLEFNRQNPSPY